jgi:cytoskeletal protein CcmA (bactofilin family)
MARASTATCGWGVLSSLRAARPQEPDQGTPGAASSVTLGPRDRLVGQLYIEGDLHVSGTVEGEVEATGNVYVAEGATVKASLSGRDVSISGLVNGTVTASKKLVVSRSGSLTGDVRVSSLAIQDGATFNGNVSMSAGGPKAAKATPAEAPIEAAPAAPVESSSQPDGPSAEKAKPKRR